MPFTKQSFVHPQTIIENTADQAGLTEEDTRYALQYLDHYYMDPNKITKFDESVIADCLIRFQTMFGLPVTGTVDPGTVKAMKFTPRCGCPDYLEVSGPLASKWGLSQITYFVESYVSGLAQKDQTDLISLAFKQWGDLVANLKFVQVASPTNANVIISGGRGPADNFDGPSNTLAWAYLPQGNNYNGQLLMKFDLDETWITNPNDRGILYLNVATHEFGHLLGLEHSSARQALMAPFYAVNITKPQPVDDIPRIQALYGVATTPPTPPPPLPPGPTPAGKVKLEVLANLGDIKINGRVPLSDSDWSLG